jgi:hypothetical protein
MIAQVPVGCGPGRTLVNGVCAARTTIRQTRRAVRRCVRRLRLVRVNATELVGPEQTGRQFRACGSRAILVCGVCTSRHPVAAGFPCSTPFTEPFLRPRCG